MNGKQKREQAFKNAKRREENRAHRRNVKNKLKLGYFENLPTAPRRVTEQENEQWVS